MGFGANLCFWKLKLFLETRVIFSNRGVRGCGGWVGLSQLKEIHVKVKIVIVRTLLQSSTKTTQYLRVHVLLYRWNHSGFLEILKHNPLCPIDFEGMRFRAPCS